jgi:hypothetical protein
MASEYDLELRISGNMGRPGMGHPSLLMAQIKQCAGKMVEGEDEPQRLH